MHADVVGDVLQHERAQERHAALQEVTLELHDARGDHVERALPLVDRLDEPGGGPHLLLDVAARFGRAVLPEHAAVEGRDAQARQPLLVQRDDVVVAHLVDVDIRRDVACVGVAEVAPRLGLEHRDHFGRLGDLLDRDAQLARQPVEAAALEHGQVVAHDARGERVVGHTQLAELDEQALGEAAGRHAGRVEVLEAAEHTLHDLDVGPGVGEEGDLLELERQEAVLVEASDDERAHLLLLVGEVGEAELPHQMIGEERPLDQHVLERGAPIVVVAAAAVPGRAMDVVAVVLGVLLPVDLADGGSRLDLGFLRLGRVLLGPVLSVDRRHLGRSLELLVDVLLQHGVLGELLVDQRLQLGARDLQDLDGLPELRRHHQLLGEPLLEDDAGVLGHWLLREYYSRNFSPR